MNKKYIDNDKLLIFFSKLALIIDSDISLFEGMGFAMEKETDQDLLRYYKVIRDKSLEGNKLSEILAELDIIKEKRYIKLIELGEYTGNLESVLYDIIDDLDMEINISNKIKSAVTYPTMLFSLTIMIIYIVIIKVVPMFQTVIQYNSIKPSKATLLIFNISDVFNANVYASFSVFALIVILLVYLFKGNHSEKMRQKLITKLFFTKNIYRNRLGLNFAKSYLLLVKSGLSMEQSFEFLAQSESDKELKLKIIEAKELLENQQDAELAFKNLDFLPEVLTGIIAVSSKTGHIEKSLENSIRVLDRDLDTKVERFLSRIEPIMIFVITIIVGFILFSVVSPVFNMISSMV